MTPITKYRNFKLTTLLMDLGYTALFNTAVLTETGGTVSTDTAVAIVDAYPVYLPLTAKLGR